MKWLLVLFSLSLFSGEFPEWMLAQVDRDYALVQPSDVSKEKVEQFIRTWTGRGGFIHYKIRDNAYSYHAFWPEDHPRLQMMNRSIGELLFRYQLPDMDFVICAEDSIDEANLEIACFAFAKNSTLQEKVLLIPDFEALQLSEHYRSQVDDGRKNYPWKERKEKAVWRGSATGGLYTEENFHEKPRVQLVQESLLHPKLLDAKLTYPLVQSETPERLESIFSNFFGNSISIRDHLQYKYQILADGNTCAYSRAFWQLFSGCTIFKHESPYIQWYYSALIPGVHYISCKRDFSDLHEKIRWAKNHDRQARKIADNAKKFAESHLKKDAIYEYFYCTLLKYAKLQRS